MNAQNEIGMCKELLALVVSADASAWVVAVDEDGAFQFVNDAYCAASGLPRERLLGMNLRELAAGSGTEERLRLGVDIALSGRPRCLYEIINGVRFRSVVVPLGRTPAGKLWWLVSTRPASTQAPPGCNGEEIPTTLTVPLFEFFGGLTDRELEILRLVAMEMTNEQIAEKINRTKRAVEWHVRSLLRKLDVGGRVPLFRVGFSAGLHEFSDADWAALMRNRRAARRPVRRRVSRTPLPGQQAVVTPPRAAAGPRPALVF